MSRQNGQPWKEDRITGRIWKLRSVLLSFPEPILALGATARWIGSLAIGWPLAAFAASICLLAVAEYSPLLLAVSVAVFIASVTMGSWKILMKLVAFIFLALAAYDTGTRFEPFPLFGVLLVVATGIDSIADRAWVEYRTWRLFWTEFRRRGPSTWADVAGKSTKVQGAVGEENQIRQRPFLAHPAVWLIPRIHGRTARVKISTDTGRNFSALIDVLDEWGSQMPPVFHMSIVRQDDYSSFGELIIRFGPPDLEIGGAEWPGSEGENGDSMSYSQPMAEGSTQGSQANGSRTGSRSTPHIPAPETGGLMSTIRGMRSPSSRTSQTSGGRNTSRHHASRATSSRPMTSRSASPKRSASRQHTSGPSRPSLTTSKTDSLGVRLMRGSGLMKSGRGKA